MSRLQNFIARRWKWLLTGLLVVLVLVVVDHFAMRNALADEFDTNYLLKDGGIEARRLKDTLIAQLHLTQNALRVTVYEETPMTYNRYIVCLFTNVDFKSVDKNELKRMLDNFYPARRYESTIKFYVKDDYHSEFHSYHLMNTDRPQ